MALGSKKNNPEWKKRQQQNTGARDNEIRAAENTQNKEVTIKLKTNYRDIAKAGDTWTTDAEKAAELVRLGRADYVK